MQYSLLTFVTLFAAARAAFRKFTDTYNRLLEVEHDSLIPMTIVPPHPRPRQASAAPDAPAAVATGQPNTQNAAMTNANGDIVSFDAANVYLDSVAKGM